MIQALRADNSKYHKNIAFLYLDWDVHSGSAITKKLRVHRQSTLVLLSGKGETGRLVSQTSTAAIKGLMDSAPDRPGNAAMCTG